jgi:cell division protein FtsQ
MLGEALFADIRLRRFLSLASLRISRYVPSRRSLAIGAGVVVAALGAYAIARETPLFAIHQVDVRGGSKAVDARVAQALAPLVGRSLVGLNGADVLRRAEAISTVVTATYDRAFPNTLRVTVVQERPIAVLRDGAAAWIVSERGRVLRPVASHSVPAFPRVWIAAKTVRVGEVLPPKVGGTLTRSLAAAGPIRARIVTASLADGLLVFHLRSGVALVLGAPNDVALKVAVAVKVLQQMPSWTRSVDVSVPSRPVTST